MPMVGLRDQSLIRRARELLHESIGRELVDDMAGYYAAVAGLTGQTLGFSKIRSKRRSSDVGTARSQGGSMWLLSIQCRLTPTAPDDQGPAAMYARCFRPGITLAIREDREALRPGATETASSSGSN